MLGVCPGCKGLIRCKRLILHLEDIDASKPSMVVSEGNVIRSSAEARDGGWTPKVCVYLSAEMFGQRGDVFTTDGFTSEFSILT